MNCKICNKKLVAIGNARKNGKMHIDWASREYHKKCWKMKNDFDFFYDIHSPHKFTYRNSYKNI